MSDDKVIHVFFGRNGDYRIQSPAEQAALSEPPEKMEAERATSDPLSSFYSQAEVARLFELSPSRLRYWAQTDFLVPSGNHEGRPLYTFQDLIALRAAKSLLDHGISLQEVRRSLDSIKKALPKIVHPLVELRVIAEGSAMLVRDDQGAFEAGTGQRVLDFRVDAIRNDVVRVLRPKSRGRDVAFERYLDACRLDEEESAFEAAELAYLDALRLDPAFTSAMNNLANLYFRMGNSEGAEALYHRALSVDPCHPEALYNLGYLAQETGDIDAAIDYLSAAVNSDPAFADAHFNLALSLTDADRHDAAAPHWRAYLKLEPNGEWAPVAQRHLNQ